MKANELMIGDYVTFADCQNDKYPSIIKIWQINEDGESFASIDGGKAVDEITIDDEIVGIPITPKILEKNGFSLDEYGEWYEREVSVKERNYWVNVAFRNDGVSVYDLDILTGGRSSICIHKNYVHELQHALRLCGIEKEIEL